MTIQAIPLSPIDASLDAQASLMDALRLMVEHDVNHVPLRDDAGGWVGLVGIDDVLRQILPIVVNLEHGLSDLTFAGDALAMLRAHMKALEGKRLGDAARRDLPVLMEDDPLLETALLLSRYDTPLPVVGADGKLRGMLSRRAFLRYLLQQGEDK